jgi:hypothetical protein
MAQLYAFLSVYKNITFIKAAYYLKACTTSEDPALYGTHVLLTSGGCTGLLLVLLMVRN